ncbi:YbaB/EbfC family nucleoid-associated protein [Actinomadura sp. NTSP31]|uniref:YbaB/EbfC family nucleoid-associated protein n=1 Tax=Actinomadura sp. NTSP31 TaxID=1735447 RepID=UPI0035BFF6B9
MTMGSPDDNRSIDSILNRSTPFAPTNADEIRSRIESPQPPAPEPEEPRQGRQETAAEQVPANTGPPKQDGPPPASTPVDFSDTGKLISEDRRIEALSTAATLARVRAEQADQLLQERRSRIFSAASRDGDVTASVDGTGRLLALDIDDGLLRGPHSRTTGRRITEAVTAATAESIRQSSAPDWSSF